MNINFYRDYIYTKFNNLCIILLSFMEFLICYYNLYLIYYFTYGTIIYYIFLLKNSAIASLWIIYFNLCTFKFNVWFFVCFQPLFIHLELIFNVFRFYFDFFVFLCVFKYLPGIRFYLISRLNDSVLFLYSVYLYFYNIWWEPYIYPFIFSHYALIRVNITKQYWDLCSEFKIFLYFYVIMTAFIKVLCAVTTALIKWTLNNSRRFYSFIWRYWKFFSVWYVRRFIKLRGVFQYTMRRFRDYLKWLDLVWRRSQLIKTYKSVINMFRYYEDKEKKAFGIDAFGFLRTNKVHKSNLILFEILQFPLYDPRVIICCMVFIFVDSSKHDMVKYLDTESDFFRWKHRYKYSTPIAYYDYKEPFNAVSENFFDYLKKAKLHSRLKLYFWMLLQIPIKIVSIFYEYWCFRIVAMRLLKKFTFYKTYRRYHWTYKWYRKVIILAPIAFCYVFYQVVKKVLRILIVYIFNIFVLLILDILTPFQSKYNFKYKNTMLFILLMSWFESFIEYRKKPFIREVFYKRKIWFVTDWPYILQHNVYPLAIREVKPTYTKFLDSRLFERLNLDALNNDLDKTLYARKSLFKYLKRELWKRL